MALPMLLIHLTVISFFTCPSFCLFSCFECFLLRYSVSFCWIHVNACLMIWPGSWDLKENRIEILRTICLLFYFIVLVASSMF